MQHKLADLVKQNHVSYDLLGREIKEGDLCVSLTAPHNSVVSKKGIVTGFTDKGKVKLLTFSWGRESKSTLTKNNIIICDANDMRLGIYSSPKSQSQVDSNMFVEKIIKMSEDIKNGTE